VVDEFGVGGGEHRRDRGGGGRDGLAQRAPTAGWPSFTARVTELRLGRRQAPVRNCRRGGGAPRYSPSE
jgi:hypothetical protein